MSDSIQYTKHTILRALGVTPAALAAMVAGCDAEPGDPATEVDSFAAQLATAPTDAAQVPPPGDLSLTVPASMDAGVFLNVDVSGADPGTTVFVIASSSTGAGPCPPVLNGVCVDLVAPVVVGSGVAGVSGTASIEVALPHRLPDGATVYLQAAGPGVGVGDTSDVASSLVTYPARDCGDLPWLTPNTVFNFSEFLACAPIPASGVCPTHTSISYQAGLRLFERNSGQSAQAPWGGWDADLFCDELSVESACCYGMGVGQWAIGRPFRVDGDARTASTSLQAGWCDDVPVSLEGLNRRTRRRLAAAWTRTAHGEHASVAAFARLVLQLVQVGAPADLVAEATSAMQDEIQHAQVSFGIASAFAGHAVGAGPLDTTGALEGTSLRTLVLDTVREGCIAETLATAQAGVAAEGCADPVIAAALRQIVEDETRHAALAWKLVRWGLEQDPSLAGEVADLFAAGLDLPLVAADLAEAQLGAHGVLSESRMHEVAHRAFAEVVIPCAAQLLGAPVHVGLAA